MRNSSLRDTGHARECEWERSVWHRTGQRRPRWRTVATHQGIRGPSICDDLAPHRPSPAAMTEKQDPQCLGPRLGTELDSGASA
jgi:hypothetical protein